MSRKVATARKAVRARPRSLSWTERCDNNVWKIFLQKCHPVRLFCCARVSTCVCLWQTVKIFTLPDRAQIVYPEAAAPAAQPHNHDDFVSFACSYYDMISVSMVCMLTLAWQAFARARKRPTYNWIMHAWYLYASGDSTTTTSTNAQPLYDAIGIVFY